MSKPSLNPSQDAVQPKFSHYFAPRRGSVKASPPVAMRCNGLTLQMSTGAGVFAKGGLDEGTQLLLESFFAAHDDDLSGQHLCDLGCGWGAVGCFLAKRYPQALVALCDINSHAVQLARMNLQQNSLHNAQAWCGDGLGAAQSKYFEAVLCNPPVRAGNAAIAELFHEAQRCLQESGELWVVLRTQQGAKSWQKRLKEQFGNCDTITIDRGYRILRSRKSAI
jgi:16S rRNA (guanine1207-N2)-methyltransferase